MASLCKVRTKISKNYFYFIKKKFILILALWVRLENRKEGRMTMDQPMKEFLWRQVQRLTSVDLFLIPTGRPDMILPTFPDPEKDIETVLCEIMQHMVSIVTLWFRNY
jgi:hypothetical protein